MADGRSSSRVEGVAVSVEVVVEFFEISEEFFVLVCFYIYIQLDSTRTVIHACKCTYKLIVLEQSLSVLPQIAVLALPRAVDQHGLQMVAELHLVVT